MEERIERWARDVNTDAHTPDLWAELQRERDIPTEAHYEDVENTLFNADERKEIAVLLRQIKGALRDSNSVSDAQMRSLEARFDNLEAAAGRVDRKDWLLLFAGTILAVVVTDLLPREALWDILGMVSHGLEHLVRLLPPLPPALDGLSSI